MIVQRSGTRYKGNMNAYKPTYLNRSKQLHIIAVRIMLDRVVYEIYEYKTYAISSV